MNHYHLFLALTGCILVSTAAFTQAVKTPSVRYLAEWKEDPEMMRKAGVKEMREFEVKKTGRVMSGFCTYDKEGYITSEIAYNNGQEIRKLVYEYSLYHHAWTKYEFFISGKKSTSRRSVCDKNGYETESFFEKPDGSFESESKTVHYYNKNNLVDSSIGQMGIFKYSWHFKYNDAGKMTEVKSKNPFNPDWHWKYTYDSTGRLIYEYWWEVNRKKDSAKVAHSAWEWDTNGRLIKQTGEGRGWKEINCTWAGDSVVVDMKQGSEFGPPEKHVIWFSPQNGTVTRMRSYNETGKLESDKWYEYLFYTQ